MSVFEKRPSSMLRKPITVHFLKTFCCTIIISFFKQQILQLELTLTWNLFWCCMPFHISKIIQTEKSKSISVILKPATLLKKILCHRSFLVNFVMRFLRIVCLQNSSGRLLLKIPFTRELKLSPQSERLDQRTF